MKGLGDKIKAKTNKNKQKTKPESLDPNQKQFEKQSQNSFISPWLLLVHILISTNSKNRNS